MNSLEAIAEMASWEGNLAQSILLDDHYTTVFTVCLEDEHNPYDLTWRYGDVSDAGFGKLLGKSFGAEYQAYVDACDWSLVFDAAYYKKAFPILAKLYHDDDALLLEHFQTVGVHEGRQASESFNAAAYRAGCDEAVQTAFGDAWECYYFYWMLNQDTQSGVAATGDYRTWQDVELTAYQAMEFQMANEYRAEAGSDPVAVDPELCAFASLRAWNDARNDVKAHDSINDKWVDDCMWAMDITYFDENTTKCHRCGRSKNETLQCPYLGFYTSPKGHYENMVNPDQRWFGTSNTYYSTHSVEYGVKTMFDIYVPASSLTPLTSR